MEFIGDFLKWLIEARRPFDDAVTQFTLIPGVTNTITVTKGDVVLVVFTIALSLVAGAWALHEVKKIEEAERMAELHDMRLERWRREAAERPAPVRGHREAPVDIESRRRARRRAAM